MTQNYTPVAWQDETTSQQGTLINAERLNQMQQAHHYADGLEEVDAIPTADPGVSYHKIVYCTADSTIYRWDGTEWTKDIDDETKALLQQEIARATEAESQLNQRVDDEHAARVDAEAAINDRITDEATELAQRIATETSTRYTADTGLGTRITNETSARETADTGLGNRITAEATARADADTTLGGRIDTEQARAEAAEQANAQAIANTYTKTEIDTALGAKADTATTYTKSETDTLLASKADQATTLAGYGITDAYTKSEADTLLGAKANDNAVVHLAGAETIPGPKTFKGAPASSFVKIASNTAFTSGTQWTPCLDFYADDGNKIVGRVVGRMGDNNSGLIALQTYNSSTGAYQGGAYLEYDGINSVLRLPEQRAYAAGNTTDVATIGTLDAYTPMVRTTGNQGIDGIKTFTGELIRQGPNSPAIYIDNMSISRSERPASTQQCWIKCRDKFFNTFGMIQFVMLENGYRVCQITMFDKNGGMHVQNILTIDEDGNVIA